MHRSVKPVGVRLYVPVRARPVRWLVLIILSGLLLFATDARGQQARTHEEAELVCNQRYDPRYVISLTGVVERVDVLAPAQWMPTSVLLTLHIGGGHDREAHADSSTCVRVYLGPVWFIEQEQISVAAGDTLTVRGSCAALETTTLLLAAEVRTQSAVLVLRDSTGVPVWEP